jgi:hypothetical protein
MEYEEEDFQLMKKWICQDRERDISQTRRVNTNIDEEIKGDQFKRQLYQEDDQNNTEIEKDSLLWVNNSNQAAKNDYESF